jgi:hypothetical protein
LVEPRYRQAMATAVRSSAERLELPLYTSMKRSNRARASSMAPPSKSETARFSSAVRESGARPEIALS